MQRCGDQAAFISAGGLPPPHRAEHLGVAGRLAAAARDDGPLPRRDPVSRPQALADALQGGSSRPASRLSGASDHGVSEAIYLRDPDENGIELYRDRPEDEWPRAEDGDGVAMVTRAAGPRGAARRSGLT